MSEITTNGIQDVREEKKQLIKQQLKELLLHAQEYLDSLEYDDTEEADNNIRSIIASIGGLIVADGEWRETE